MNKNVQYNQEVTETTETLGGTLTKVVTELDQYMTHKRQMRNKKKRYRQVVRVAGGQVTCGPLGRKWQ